ncbi:hypothetical protein GCM10027046_32720 [Uliginosibacterium flavum]
MLTGPVQPGTGTPPLDELDEPLELDELEELEEELEDDELLELEDELEEELDELLLELEELPSILIEHSFTPPAIRPPKVASLHTKLPLSVL